MNRHVGGVCGVGDVNAGLWHPTGAGRAVEVWTAAGQADADTLDFVACSGRPSLPLVDIISIIDQQWLSIGVIAAPPPLRSAAPA